MIALSKHFATFTWNEPYTLIGVPVLGYDALIQFTSAKDEDILLTTNLTVYMTKLTVANPFINGFCTHVNIYILARNMAGLGKPATVSGNFRGSKF